MRFVLVHGGFHGAWCWERTVEQLTILGHEAVAIDLPGHGARADETEPTTMEGRIEAITSVVTPGDVLVGHSGGGFDVTMAANAVPDQIGHVCYLAAGLPREGRTWPEAMAMRLDGSMGDFDVAGMLQHLRIGDDGSMSFSTAAGAKEMFWHDCDDATVAWAFERMCPERAGETSDAPVSIPAFWAADLPRSFIRCLDDRAMPQWLADTVTERLGVEQLTIDASHSPFMSRPAELAELIVHATSTTPLRAMQPN